MDRPDEKVWLWIDPTRKCNLKCALCYTSASHGASDLDMLKLKGIIANIRSEPRIQVAELTFNWRGEPLMNRAFPELLGYLTSADLGFPIQFHTNAMILTPRIAKRVVDAASGCTIYLSIDGGTKESHESNRGVGTFDRAIAGSWNLLRARGTRRWPRIVLYQLDLREIPSRYSADFLALAHAVDAWQRVQPILPTGDATALASSPETARGSPMVNAWREVQFSEPVPQGPCFWMGYALCVSPEADVSVCLVSHSSSGVLGNLLVHSAGEILERARAYRRRVTVEGRQAIPHCMNCRKIEGTARSPRPLKNLQGEFHSRESRVV